MMGLAGQTLMVQFGEAQFGEVTVLGRLHLTLSLRVHQRVGLFCKDTFHS